MKRKNIKNDKVLRAITIGLSTMIAATSAPLNVYAGAGDEPATADGIGDTTSQPGSRVETEPEESVPEAVVTEEEVKVDVVEVEPVTDAIDQAAKDYSEHAESVDNETLDAVDAAVNADIVAAKKEIQNIKGVEDINNVIVQTAVADANIAELQKNLEGVYLENSNEDDNHKARLQYDVPRENGDLKIDENNCPEVGNGSAKEQLSGQYNVDGEKSTTGANLTNRSVQGTYQAGMGKIQEAITARTNGDEDAENKALAQAEEYLRACENRLDNSTKVLADATAQYKAAQEAASKAEASLENAKKCVNGAIASTEAARANLKAAREKAQKYTDISNQQYGIMINYFSKAIENDTAKYDKNGELDVNASAKAIADLDPSVSDINKDKNKYYQLVEGDKLSNDVYAPGRELLKQLVMLKLEGDGVDKNSITFGTEKDAIDVDGTKYDQYKGESKVTINTSEEEGVNDTVKLSGTGNHYYTNVSGDNGRMNHIKVTYTDSEGNPQTKYYNVAYKGTKYEGEDVDLTKGICFITEVTYTPGENGKKGTWSYAAYNPKNSVFLDDYTLTAGYRKAAEDVAKAEAEVDRLEKELQKFRDDQEVYEGKVNSYKDTLKELEGELDKAHEAYENSKKSLQDFQDLYRYMTEGLQPSDLIEDDIIPEEDDILGGGDETTGGDETPGAGGGVVFDPSTGTFSAPAYGFGSTILPGFTGGPATGVLGVRTGGGTEADEGGAADSRTNVAPRADFGTVNKVLGSKQNKDNSQIVKKIKDNEIPLAEIPNMDDEVTMNWMWLLIIFLLGATGKKMYDEYKKKKEAEEAAKINK